ncbi:MAG: hypothetical protein U0795_18955 [Pirellulales bacterium]
MSRRLPPPRRHVWWRTRRRGSEKGDQRVYWRVFAGWLVLTGLLSQILPHYGFRPPENFIFGTAATAQFIGLLYGLAGILLFFLCELDNLLIGSPVCGGLLVLLTVLWFGRVDMDAAPAGSTVAARQTTGQSKATVDLPPLDLPLDDLLPRVGFHQRFAARSDAEVETIEKDSPVDRASSSAERPAAWDESAHDLQPSRFGGLPDTGPAELPAVEVALPLFTVAEKNVQLFPLRDSPGNPISERAPEGGLLVGLCISRGQDWGGSVDGIRPVYQVGDRYEWGEWYGDETSHQTLVIAKPGYAIANARVRAGLVINAIQVAFAAVGERGMQVKEFYLSPWVGTEGGTEGAALESPGPIVGVTVIIQSDQNRRILSGLGVQRALKATVRGE